MKMWQSPNCISAIIKSRIEFQLKKAESCEVGLNFIFLCFICSEGNDLMAASSLKLVFDNAKINRGIRPAQ